MNRTWIFQTIHLKEEFINHLSLITWLLYLNVVINYL